MVKSVPGVSGAFDAQPASVSPVQGPEQENNCMRRRVPQLAPRLLTVIVGRKLFATNRYHTSGEVEVPQLVAILVEVAFCKVWPVSWLVPVTQVGIGVIVNADAQVLLPGCANTDPEKNKISVNTQRAGRVVRCRGVFIKWILSCSFWFWIMA